MLHINIIFCIFVRDTISNRTESNQKVTSVQIKDIEFSSDFIANVCVLLITYLVCIVLINLYNLVIFKFVLLFVGKI